MRKLFLGLFFTCLAFAAQPDASAQLSLFQGNWRNTDPGTRGITRLQINTGSSPVRVHAWGSCAPSDCDLGTVDGFAYGPNVTSNLNTSARAISAIFRSGFNEQLFIIRPAGAGRLQADVYDRFTDSSGRTAFVTTYTFARQSGGGGGVGGRQDCLSYNPSNLRIINEGSSGWLLTDGSSRMLILDNRADAERALALARRHTAHCFIGRNNNRPNRRDFIVEYWTGDSGIRTTIAGEDCISYNPSTLEIRNEGAGGWLLTDGNSRMLMLANRADAEQALGITSQSSRQCFIGRNNTRPNRKDYIVEYWR
ncbi:MAG TPA: hypothetical protein VF791_15010 [Pyrinomonadaceae bacterium]